MSICVSVDMVPGADEVIKRVLEGGDSMTEIDLTRDQCTALDKLEGGNEDGRQSE